MEVSYDKKRGEITIYSSIPHGIPKAKRTKMRAQQETLKTKIKIVHSCNPFYVSCSSSSHSQTLVILVQKVSHLIFESDHKKCYELFMNKPRETENFVTKEA